MFMGTTFTVEQDCTHSEQEGARKLKRYFTLRRMPLEWLPANLKRLYGNTLTKGRSGISWDKVVKKIKKKRNEIGGDQKVWKSSGVIRRKDRSN